MMRIWIDWCDGLYVSGWRVSGERFDGYVYDVPTKADAQKAFEEEFGVKTELQKWLWEE